MKLSGHIALSEQAGGSLPQRLIDHISVLIYLRMGFRGNSEPDLEGGIYVRTQDGESHVCIV
jgi:hypothetical protein